jgi:hypothetical protein
MKSILTSILVIFTCVVFAQETQPNLLSKGSSQVGFSLTDMTSADAYGAQVHLRYGYFVANRVQIGLDVNSGARDYAIFYASAGPFAKIHLTEKWFSPFAIIGSDFGICDYTDRRPAHYMTGKLSWNKYYFGGGIGMYGLADHWGFETSLSYQVENYTRNDDGLPTKITSQWTIPIRWRITYSF